MRISWCQFCNPPPGPQDPISFPPRRSMRNVVFGPARRGLHWAYPRSASSQLRTRSATYDIAYSSNTQHNESGKHGKKSIQLLLPPRPTPNTQAPRLVPHLRCDPFGRRRMHRELHFAERAFSHGLAQHELSYLHLLASRDRQSRRQTTRPLAAVRHGLVSTRRPPPPRSWVGRVHHRVPLSRCFTPAFPCLMHPLCSRRDDAFHVIAYEHYYCCTACSSIFVMRVWCAVCGLFVFGRIVKKLQCGGFGKLVESTKPQKFIYNSLFMIYQVCVFMGFL